MRRLAQSAQLVPWVVAPLNRRVNPVLPRYANPSWPPSDGLRQPGVRLRAPGARRSTRLWYPGGGVLRLGEVAAVDRPLTQTPRRGHVVLIRARTGPATAADHPRGAQPLTEPLDLQRRPLGQAVRSPRLDSPDSSYGPYVARNQLEAIVLAPAATPEV